MVAMSTARALSVVSLLATTASAVVLEKMGNVPSGWKQENEASPDTPLNLQIGLAMQNLDQLESKLMDVSTPGNANYGKHLSADEVNALFAPSQAGNDAVMKWLSSAGVTQVANDGQFISFATTVEKANQLLGASFKNFVDGKGNNKIRTGEYSVPDDVAQYIDLVTPTVYLGTVKANAVIPNEARAAPAPAATTADNHLKGNCTSRITPNCLKKIYNYGDYKPDPKTGASIGFGSFLNQSANYKDLAQFQQLFNLPQQNFTVELINGGINNQTRDEAINGEANLDVQYINGMSHPLPITEFITGGSPPIIPNVDTPPGAQNQNEPYLPYYQHLLRQKDLPPVITNSYGDDEQTVPFRYASRVCNMIGMLGLRGISVLESAGDTGVGAACRANDGSNALQFTPQFPGTCPYITAVGGTQSIYPEVAWDAGSGGFSNYFQQPYYQHDAVNTYLTKHVSAETRQYYKNYFNASGRGFPDVSAHSLTPDYVVIYEGQISPSGGTSAACPVFGALVAQLNDARFRAGKPSLGFLNPWLYLVGKNALTDITGGQSDGCTGTNLQTGQPVVGGGIIPGAHWNATEGWDPVTGLGTPNFQELIKVALKY